MRKNPWPVFLTIIGLLSLGVLWQSIQSSGVIALILGGSFLIYLSLKGRRRNFFLKLLGIAGALFLFFGLSTSWLFWIALVIIVLFFGLESYHVVPSFRGKGFNQEKSLHMIDTVQPLPKGGKRFKRSWFANERLGTKDVYEWDDINIIKVSGDTFIDLGNTLLPKEDNIILIRKGFGQTKIFVPTGIAVMVEHSALVGVVTFEDEKYSLRNESIRLYSEDYDYTSRKLKIFTSTLIGDLEVIQL